MYRLSQKGVLRSFSAKKIFIPIQGELAKTGATVDLNDEAFEILSFVSEEAKSLDEINTYMNTKFNMMESDEGILINSIKEMVEAKLIIETDQ